MSEVRGPLRVAILGGAHPHTPDYVEVIEGDPRAELSAYLPATSGATSLVAEELHVSGPDDALSGADLAVISSTTAEHLPLVEEANARSIPLLLEKPLGADRASSAAVAEALAAAAPGSSVALFLRHSPAIRALREAIIQTGGDRRPTGARLVFGHDQLSAWRLSPHLRWMLDPVHGAVDCLSDLGFHLLDLLIWIDPDVDLTLRSARHEHEHGVPVAVAGTATLDWGGTAVELVTSWSATPTLSLGFFWEGGSVTYTGGTLAITTGAGESRSLHPHPSAAESLNATLARLRSGAVDPGPATADSFRVGELLRDAAQCGGGGQITLPDQ